MVVKDSVNRILNARHRLQAIPGRMESPTFFEEKLC